MATSDDTSVIELETGNMAEPGAPNTGLLDLSKQLRNLLLMRPVYKLEIDKHRFRSTDGTTSLFANLDTHYLVLSLFDHLMEGVALSGGRTSREAIIGLTQLIEAMDPLLSDVDVEAAAAVVFDAMVNRGENYKDFDYEYFNGPSATNRRFKFSLIRFSQEDGQQYLYKPTPEGYLVYLGMLDLSPEDSAELMEKMLDLMVQRGKYKEAIDIARRARTISIEYRQIIGEAIQRANRAPASVKWSENMTPRLNEARGHAEQRRKEDERMIESVDKSVFDAKELESKKDLYSLRDILSGASTIRTKLLREIASAPEEFLTAQRFVFRPRGLIGLPDLDERMFPAILSSPVDLLQASADTVISALYRPVIPKIYDLNSLVFIVYTKRRVVPISEYKEATLKALEPIAPEFPVEMIEHVHQWLTGIWNKTTSMSIEEILERAVVKLSFEETICLVLILYRSFAPSETAFKNISVQLSGRRFRTNFVEGASLHFSSLNSDKTEAVSNQLIIDGDLIEATTTTDG